MAALESFQVGGEELGYLFDFSTDGVFLTVYPTDDEQARFDMLEMKKVLAQYRAEEYDIVELSRVVRDASGEPVKLAETFGGDPDAEEDGLRKIGNAHITEGLPVADFHVEVSRDRMTATVRFDNVEGCQMPTPAQVLMLLNKLGIVYGIDKQNLAAQLKIGRDFEVAHGLQPEKGKDAEIVRYYDLSNKGKATTDEFDRADFKNLNLFVLAKMGDVLAHREPHTLGVPGKTIFGDEVASRPGKPKPVPAGKFTQIQDDNDVVALIDGQIVDTGTKISVDPRFEVKGDVCVGTGNIEFAGCVHITGSVEQGFSVKATGDVQIDGSVPGGNVEGNNVYIKGGVRGLNSGRVKAGGEVVAMFAENADIEAGGTIKIADAALHSRLTAGERIIVEGKRGIIAGGVLVAGKEVRAKTIGNAMNVATRISVGDNPTLQREYQTACKELVEAKKKLDMIQKTLQAIRKVDMNTLPKNRLAQITQLARSQFPLAEEIKAKEKQIAMLEYELKDNYNGRVRAKDTIYPGVRLSINSVLKNIQAEQHCCSLVVDEDAVITAPY